MTHRLIFAVAAATLTAASGFAHAQGSGTDGAAPSATAPASGPKIETLSTQHADPNADRTVGESVKPENNGDDDALAAAARIDQQMSNESEGGYRRRRGR